MGKMEWVIDGKEMQNEKSKMEKQYKLPAYRQAGGRRANRYEYTNGNRRE